jgi:hypothetical protein
MFIDVHRFVLVIDTSSIIWVRTLNAEDEHPDNYPVLFHGKALYPSICEKTSFRKSTCCARCTDPSNDSKMIPSYSPPLLTSVIYGNK